MSSVSFTGTLTNGQSVVLASPLWFVTAPNVGLQIPGAARLVVVDDVNEESSLLLNDTAVGTPAAPASGMRLYAQTNMLKGIAADGSLLSLSGAGGQNIPTVYNVKDVAYGAKGDGINDDRPAIQAAITAASFGAHPGGVVYLPPGTYVLASGGPLSVAAGAAAVTIRGAGRSATTVKLTGNAKSFFSMGWTVTDFAIEDLTVDSNNNIGTFGVIMSLTPFPGDLKNIRVSRVDTINVGLPVFAGIERRNIDITSITPAFSSTQQVIQDVLVEDCKFGRSGGGGNYGIVIQGYPQGLTGGLNTKSAALLGQPYYANVYMDRITYRRCVYDSGQTVAQFNTYSSCGFMVGGYGNGDRCRIEDCVSIRAVDDAFEIDSMRDVVVRGCKAVDAPNESFYFANLGAMPDPDRQHIKVIDCTELRTALNSGNSTNSLMSNSVAAVPLGHVSVQNHTVINQGCRSTGPTFEGNLKSLTIKGLRISQTGWTVTATGNNFFQSANGIRLQLAEGRPKVTIEDVVFEESGTFDSAGFTGTQIETNVLDFDVLGDVDLTVSGVQSRVNVTRANAGTVTHRGLRWSVGNLLTAQDNQAVSTIGTDYLFDAGSVIDCNQIGGTLNPSGNLTTERRIIWLHQSAQYYKGHVGPYTDGAMWAKFVPQGGSFVGYKGGVIVKRIDASNYVEAYVIDDGVSTKLFVDKIVAGARTNLVTSAAAVTRLAASVPFWVRCITRGDTLTADYYVAGAPTTVAGAGEETVSYTFSTAEALQFGERGQQGWGGIVWVPNDPASTVDDISKVTMSVARGSVQDVSFPNLTGVTSFKAADFVGTSLILRFVGLFQLRRFNNSRAAGITSVTEFNGDTTQLRTSRLSETTYVTPPVVGTIGVGASPFTYTNQDGYDEDVYIFGGTVTAVNVARQGAAPGLVATSSVPLGVRLSPGDQVLVSYAVAPTMQKVPVP